MVLVALVEWVPQVMIGVRVVDGPAVAGLLMLKESVMVGSFISFALSGDLI